MIKMGKKESIVKIESVEKKYRGKEAAKVTLESGRESVYVLYFMFVTFPTSQAEMFALKLFVASHVPEKTFDISVTRDVSQS